MPPKWEAAWCDQRQRWFYQDRTTGNSTWDRPQACTLELPKGPPAGHQERTATGSGFKLPTGWEEHYDHSHGRFYFFNRRSGVRQWNSPEGSVPLAGGPAGAAQGNPQNAAPSPTPAAATSRASPAPAAASRRPGEWNHDDFFRRLQAAENRHGPEEDKRKHVKAVLKEVAESNYEMRHQWKVPRTVAVSYSKCSGTRVKGMGKAPLISFSDKSTADALLHFGQQGQKVCALNFANGERVGGGYKTGATAQEEDLCRRCPNLYTTLFQASRDGLYPFGPCTHAGPDRPGKYCDVLFTKDVVVARASRDEGYRLLSTGQQAAVSMVTAAAPNVNFANEVYDLALMRQAVKTIFIAPAIQEPELRILVLGAWGCGAFGGKPEDIAPLFVKVITDDRLGNLYEHIHFAIPGADGADRNATLFRQAFREAGVAFSELPLSSAARR